MRSPAAGPITLGRAHGRLGASLALAAILSGVLGAQASATDISALPFAITAPGTYNVTTDLVVSAGAAIVILANDVVLDLGGHTISGTMSTEGIELLGVSRVTVRNGVVSGTSLNVYLENASDNLVEGVTSRNTNGGGINLSHGSSRNTIQDNTLVQDGSAGIVVIGSSNNVIQRNTTINCGYGIRLSSASGNHLKGNTTSDGTATGIRLESSSNNNHLQSNRVSNIGIANGIEVLGCSQNFLQDNTSSNGNGTGLGMGIVIGEMSNDNTLQGNTTTGNGDVGIYVAGSNDNTLKNNTANGNGTSGILVQTGSGNTLRKNDAFNNGAFDLYDTTCDNTWKGNNFGTSNGACIR